jgi:FMN phosphatase YigB (HAD superfamily)
MELDHKEIIPLLAKLHIKYRLAVATDDTDSYIRWTVPSLNLENIFDDILVSWNLKCLKEDFNEKGESLFFSKYLKDHSLKAKDCFLIDNSEDTENKIENYGIKYLKIDSPDNLPKILKDLSK